MLSDNDKANRWIDKIAEISDKVAVARKSNVVQTAMATIISVNASDYTVRLLSSPDDGSQDFNVYSKTTETLSVDDAVMLHYIGDLTNAYIFMKIDGGNLPVPYYLPSGGIPESDMTADVGKKLNSYSNVNLLANGYFVGGGSQATTGAFPINQRGNTSYTGSVYCIDRWKMVNTYGTTTIDSDGITISHTASLGTGYRLFEQRLSAFPNDQICTASVLVLSVNGKFGLGFGSAGTSSNRIYSSDITSAGVYTATGTLSGITDGLVMLYPRDNVSQAQSIKIAAIKFEVGPEQTLAYYDSASSSWKVRDIPEYNTEYIRCLFWYQYYSSYNSSGYVTSSAKDYRMPINLVTPIHPSATASFSYVSEARKAAGGYSSHYPYNTQTAATSLTTYNRGGMYIELKDTISTAVDTNNSMLIYSISGLKIKYEP